MKTKPAFTCRLLLGLALVGALADVSRAQDPARRATDPDAPVPAAAPLDPAAALVWPKRLAPPDRPGAAGVVLPVDAPHGLAGYRLGPASFRTVSPANRADAVAAAGDAPVELEGDSAFVFVPARPPRDPAKPAPAAHAASEYFKFVSVRHAPAPASALENGGALQLQRTWFAFYEPAAGSPRGLALLMPGLFNTPEPVIEHVIGRLRGRGWAVLRMMAQPSRFTERLELEIDPARLDDAAGRLAVEMQDRVAECAYSVQAAFDHLLAAHPALATLPRVAIGMSGGAMTLPSVVAREPGRYAGAVLIAGGADLYAITSESNYRAMIGSLNYRWSRPPADGENDQLDRLYLEHATLDSYHTAAALRGKPVLMIHGTHDGAVPARLGDLLWERLGRPERWSEEAGHEEVFMRLPQKADRLLDWLDQHILAEPRG